MPKGFLAYYSDYVIGAGGSPIVGATVTCYPTSAFASGTLPVGGSPGVTATATQATDSTGNFIFAAVPPDDYHILVAYTPLGGSAVYLWRYHVPFVAADLVKRAVAIPRAAALPRALSRLLGGQSVTIFALGDEVTIGYNATGTVTGGWPALLAGSLATLYPTATVVRQDPNFYSATSDAAIPSWGSTTVQTGASSQVITIVNAGVKGDTVLRALCRFANLTSSWPGADVAIVGLGLWESTSGLSQQSMAAPDFGSNLESLVNIIRTLTQAEILLCTPHANPPNAAGFDAYADQVRGLAGRCGTGLCDIRQLWLDRYVSGGLNDGYDPWLLSGTSRIFPIDAGHAAIAGEVVKHFLPGQSVPFERGVYGAGKSYELVRVPYTSKQVALVGAGWALHAGWQGVALSSPQSGNEYVSSTSGNYVQIQGRFCDLAMLCRRFSDCGQVSVVVDGGSPVTIDLYRAYPASVSDLGDANGGSAPQDRVLLAHGLTDAVHTVVVTVLATKNAGSSGYNFRFESFELGRFRRHGYEVESNDAENRLQSGSSAVSLAASSTGSQAITFATSFTLGSTNPIVVATSQDVNYFAVVTAITDTGFTLWAVRRDGTNVTASPTMTWLAFG